MSLSSVKMPASKPSSDAEAYLGRKHNEFSGFETLEHLVLEGEDILGAGT